jgi:hypothetical protein
MCTTYPHALFPGDISSGHPAVIPTLLAFIHMLSTSFFDLEKLSIMPEQAPLAEKHNEKQQERCIYFRFIHLSTEPTTTIIYFVF